jgi:hypothetical protein
MDKDKSTRFMLKVVGDVATAMATGLLVVGDRAGLFKAMVGAGPLGAAELADRSGVLVRYVEEWLAAMAGAGYVEYDATSDRFTLPDEHAQFLTDPGSEYYLGGLYGSLPGLMAMAPKLAQAFQTGSGIAFADFGSEMPQMLEVMNRPVYEARLVRHWLPALPEVVSRLQAGRWTSVAARAWCRSRWPRPSPAPPSPGSTWTRLRSTSPAATPATPDWPIGCNSRRRRSRTCPQHRAGT